MKLKPPTIRDNPKLKRKNNRKRKFEDEQSLPKINKMFLSVDSERLSDNPLRIQRCTDSTPGQHSTHVQRDDAIKPGLSGDGKVTCQISDHVKPDLANSNNMISLSK